MEDFCEEHWQSRCLGAVCAQWGLSLDARVSLLASRLLYCHQYLCQPTFIACASHRLLKALLPRFLAILSNQASLIHRSMPLPHISSHTLLYEPRRNQPISTSAMALFLTLSNFVTALQPRKTRYRSTFIAVAALLVVSTYIFFARHPSLSSYALRRTDTPAVDQIAVALEAMHNSRLSGDMRASRKHKHLLHKGVQLTLDPAQELAAISSFLASLPQNVIPLSVDPSVAIDPQLVLDFDTRSSRALEEVQHMVDDVWLRNPVFLYSKVS